MDFNELLKFCVQLENATYEFLVELREKEEEVSKSIKEWLNTYRIRSLSSIADFMQLLEKLFKIKAYENGRLIFESSLASDSDLRQGLKRNKDFFNNLIEKYNTSLNGILGSDYNEDEEMFTIRSINTIETIIEALEKASSLTGKLSFDRKRHRYIRHFISDYFDFLDSIILVSMRWIEIELNKESKELNLSLQLLEWDINLLLSKLYELEKTAGRIKEEKSEEKDKTQKFAEVVVELLQ